VTATGNFYREDSEISTSEIEKRLSAAAKQEPQPEIHIRGDKNLRLRAWDESDADGATSGHARTRFCD
jgi:biopolymer transport protein ExbD